MHELQSASVVEQVVHYVNHWALKHQLVSIRPGYENQLQIPREVDAFHLSVKGKKLSTSAKRRMGEQK